MTKTAEVSGKLTTELGHWCYAHPQEAADRIEGLEDDVKRLHNDKMDLLHRLTMWEATHG